jgi:hypothetical protein
MFKYIVNQSIFDEFYHRVYAHNGVVLSCSCHKDLAISEGSVWKCTFLIKDKEVHEEFITMKQAESKFIKYAEVR